HSALLLPCPAASGYRSGWPPGRWTQTAPAVRPAAPRSTALPVPAAMDAACVCRCRCEARQRAWLCQVGSQIWPHGDVEAEAAVVESVGNVCADRSDGRHPANPQTNAVVQLE